MTEFLILLGGVLIGVAVTTLLLVKDPIGTLKVNNSDPDSPPYLFLEIDSGKAYKLQKDKHITLRVDCRKNNIPYYGN